MPKETTAMFTALIIFDLWFLLTYVAAVIFLLVWLLWRGRRVQFKTVRLLGRDGEQIVWRVFKGRWLAGNPDSMGRPALGELAENSPDYWFVIEGYKTKKIVVYHVEKVLASSDAPGTLVVYDSLPAAAPFMPNVVYEKAALRAGLRQPAPGPPEVPLNV
jgi:hypothetical protein